MGTQKYGRVSLANTALLGLALGLGLVACGDDALENRPIAPNFNFDGSVVNTPIDSGVSIDSGIVVSNDGGVPTTKPPEPSSDCKGENGCYSCKPTTTTTSPQLLNTCATGCRPFDNAARIPGFTGTLPPLQ